MIMLRRLIFILSIIVGVVGIISGLWEVRLISLPGLLGGITMLLMGIYGLVKLKGHTSK